MSPEELPEPCQQGELVAFKPSTDGLLLLGEGEPMSEGQSPPIIGEGGADIGGAPRGLSACMEAPVDFVEVLTELSTNVKDFLGFGFLEDLLVPSFLVPCSLLCFIAPLVVLALLPLLLSLLSCMDEPEAL